MENVIGIVIMVLLIAGAGGFAAYKFFFEKKDKAKDPCADGSCDPKPVDPCADGSCKPVDPCADGSCDPKPVDPCADGSCAPVVKKKLDVILSAINENPKIPAGTICTYSTGIQATVNVAGLNLKYE